MAAGLALPGNGRATAAAFDSPDPATSSELERLFERVIVVEPQPAEKMAEHRSQLRHVTGLLKLSPTVNKLRQLSEQYGLDPAVPAGAATGPCRVEARRSARLTASTWVTSSTIAPGGTVNLRPRGRF